MSTNSWLSVKTGCQFILISAIVSIIYFSSINVVQYVPLHKGNFSIRPVIMSSSTQNKSVKNESTIQRNLTTPAAKTNASITVPIVTAKWNTYTEANVKNVDHMFPNGTPAIMTVTSPYLIPNTKLCSNLSDLTYVVLIHTTPKYFDRRQSLRSTWANHTFYRNVNSRTVFLLGAVLDNKLQSKIKNESEKFGDIVQGTFIDAYKNLTLKNIMGLRWVTENCRNAKYVVKADDDTFVNMHIAIKYIFPLLSQNNKELICRVVINSPIVRPGGIAKWAVSKDFFKNQTAYPAPNCLGFFTFFSVSLAMELFEKAKPTPYFFIDDVFVYGILASKVKGITWRNVKQGVQLQRSGVMQALKEKQLVAGAARNDKDMQMIFRETNGQFDKQ